MTSVTARTRQHKSGNSYSVRLPKSVAYERPDQELIAERDGDTVVLRPAEMTPAEWVAWREANPGPGLPNESMIRWDGRENPWIEYGSETR